MAEVIRDAARKNKINAKDCALALHSRDVFTRRITVPAMTRRRSWASILPFEFRDYIADDKDKYSFDYAVLGMQRDEPAAIRSKWISSRPPAPPRRPSRRTAPCSCVGRASSSRWPLRTSWPTRTSSLPSKNASPALRRCLLQAPRCRMALTPRFWMRREVRPLQASRRSGSWKRPAQWADGAQDGPAPSRRLLPGCRRPAPRDLFPQGKYAVARIVEFGVASASAVADYFSSTRAWRR